MTALELYKFINENTLEWRWQEDENNDDNVILFIPFDYLEEFTKLINLDYINDGYHRVIMKGDSICIFLDEVCSAYGLDINEIFEK